MKKTFKYKFYKFLATSAISNLQFFKRPLFFIFGGSTAYSLKGEKQRIILDQLKPGDVLLRRWDRYIITNLFISGYWKHVAVYIGNNRVIHAVTAGVVEEDILTFLRCDQCAILRASQEDPIQLKNIVSSRARKLLGMPYDFLFETDESGAYYCTEVIRYCYYEFKSVDIKSYTKSYNDAIPPNDLLKCGFEVIYDSSKHKDGKIV